MKEAGIKKWWEKWKRLGNVIGNYISTAFLIVFYFTFFVLFALIFRLFSDPLRRKVKGSNYIEPKKQMKGMEDFIHEF